MAATYRTPHLFALAALLAVSIGWWLSSRSGRSTHPLASPGADAGPEADDEGWFAFEPETDPFKSGAALDLRALNESWRARLHRSEGR